MSQIAIPLPFTPVPLTLSVAAVLLCGILLSPRGAVLCQVGYLLLGAVGAPVFANFSGGTGILLGPTGGYLLAYPLMSGVVALCRQSMTFSVLGRTRLAASLLCGELAALAICYALGTLWLAQVQQIPFSTALSLAVIPFIVPDFIKAGLALSLGLTLRRRVNLDNPR